MINAIGTKREAIVSTTANATARYKKCSSAHRAALTLEEGSHEASNPLASAAHHTFWF
jgi:hypothetical protein